MRKILILCIAAAVLAVVSTSLQADVLVQGNGWKISDLYDTKFFNTDDSSRTDDPAYNKWTLSLYNSIGGSVKDSTPLSDFLKEADASKVFPSNSSVQDLLGEDGGYFFTTAGQGNYLNDYGNIWSVSTTFNVAQDNSETDVLSLAHIAFNILTGAGLDGIYINGKKLAADAYTLTESGENSWFEIVLKTSDYDTESPVKLEFIYDFTKPTTNQATNFTFGIKFDKKNSKITEVTPEPATLALFGLGLAGLAVLPLRRRMK